MDWIVVLQLGSSLSILEVVARLVCVLLASWYCWSLPHCVSTTFWWLFLSGMSLAKHPTHQLLLENAQLRPFFFTLALASSVRKGSEGEAWNGYQERLSSCSSSFFFNKSLPFEGSKSRTLPNILEPSSHHFHPIDKLPAIGFQSVDCLNRSINRPIHRQKNIQLEESIKPSLAQWSKIRDHTMGKMARRHSGIPTRDSTRKDRKMGQSRQFWTWKMDYRHQP